MVRLILAKRGFRVSEDLVTHINIYSRMQLRPKGTDMPLGAIEGT